MARMYVKQKRYQTHVREQTLVGLANSPEGHWIPARNVLPTVAKNVMSGTAKRLMIP